MNALAAKSERTRAELLAAARTAFAEHGYVNVSLRDITESLGLTKGAMYHHFASKEALLEQVLTQIETELLDRLGSVIEAADDPNKAVEDGTVEYLRIVTQPEYAQLLLIDGPHYVPGDRMTAIAENPLFGPFIERIEQRSSEGVLPDAPVMPSLMLYSGAMRALATWIAEDRDARLDQGLAVFAAWADTYR